MNRARSLAAAAAAVLALGVGASTAVASAASAQVAARHAKPRIVARPDNLMVNTDTVLSGSGFAPHHRLLIWECSMKGWIVPLKVCNHPNAVRVRANADGRFTVKFKALVCPEPRRPVPAGFSRTCYVGVPTIQGVDTETLVGAAKLVVTGP